MTVFQEYLHAKRAVDDRALNRRVLDTLRTELPDGPLDVAEVGAGVGTGIVRLLDWDVLPDPTTYTAIDRRPENVAAARSRIQDADFASETSALSRAQVLQQAATAMVAQANQLPQQVLQLLR